MAETIEVGCDGNQKWLWYDVMKDLDVQGGLKNVEIFPLSVNAHGCGGQYLGNPFYITWIPNRFLLVTMQQFSQPLIDAFSKVVEYQPFCRYTSVGDLETVEWDKIDPESRFAELLQDEKVKNLVHL